MSARIADELDRTDLTTQIQREIKSAVAHYENRRFFFNEARLTGLALIDGQEFYTSSDNSNIPNLIYIDSFKVARSATDKWELDRKPFEELDFYSDSNSAAEGQPTWYAYYAKQIRLYPIPNASYSAVIAGVYALADLSLTSDTNAWMTDGEALIRSRAKRNILRNVIRDQELANEMAGQEREEYLRLTEVTNSRKSTGTIFPTQF